MNFVLDSSITMAWYFEDEATEVTESLLEALAEGNAIVPSLWPLEVANVLAISERRGRTSQAKTTQFLQLLNTLPIIIDQNTGDKAFTDLLTLARVHQLTIYDATYLELAIREGLPLFTLDRELEQVARNLGVATL